MWAGVQVPSVWGGLKASFTTDPRLGTSTSDGSVKATWHGRFSNHFKSYRPYVRKRRPLNKWWVKKELVLLWHPKEKVKSPSTPSNLTWSFMYIQRRTGILFPFFVSTLPWLRRGSLRYRGYCVGLFHIVTWSMVVAPSLNIISPKMLLQVGAWNHDH